MLVNEVFTLNISFVRADTDFVEKIREMLKEQEVVEFVGLDVDAMVIITSLREDKSNFIRDNHRFSSLVISLAVC